MMTVTMMATITNTATPTMIHTQKGIESAPVGVDEAELPLSGLPTSLDSKGKKGKEKT